MEITSCTLVPRLPLSEVSAFLHFHGLDYLDTCIYKEHLGRGFLTQAIIVCYDYSGRFYSGAYGTVQ